MIFLRHCLPKKLEGVHCVFQLPISVVRDCGPDDDVVKAGPTSPYDHIAGWWILLPYELATKTGNFENVV